MCVYTGVSFAWKPQSTTEPPAQCVSVCELVPAGVYVNVCVPDKRLSGGGRGADAATDKPFSTQQSPSAHSPLFFSHFLSARSFTQRQ